MLSQSHENDHLSVWWRYAVIIVMIVGFSILGFVTSLAYDNAPPIPNKVIDSNNNVIFTKENIQEGQSIFLKYNLMEHGTLWGHGAYLGPDYTADYLHQEALTILDSQAKKNLENPLQNFLKNSNWVSKKKYPSY